MSNASTDLVSNISDLGDAWTNFIDRNQVLCIGDIERLGRTYGFEDIPGTLLIRFLSAAHKTAFLLKFAWD